MTLSTFEAALKAAQNIEQLNQALVRYLADHSITAFAFTYYSYYPNTQNKIKFAFSSDFFKRWHEHYVSEGYEDVDSTLDLTYRSSLPLFWDLQQQLKDAKSLREQQMRLDSIQFGGEKGLAIPVHGPQEDFAVLVLTQMRGQKWMNNWQTLQYELFAAAYYYYTYLQHHLLNKIQPSKKHQLNQREIQCLTLIAKQYSIESIASALNITERTVNYHIQRLNKKLGVQNKYQSVIKALNIGLIKI